MSQHDYDIANAAGATVRSDLNSVLAAIATWNSGSSDPATTFARMRAVNTTTGVVKRRNAANSAWLIESTDDETRTVARSSNTILDESDIGKTFVATSTFTQTLTAAATLGDGWWVRYRNDGSGTITLDANSTEQIDGATTQQLGPGEACTIVCDGTGFKTLGRKNGEYRSVQVFTASGTWNKPAGLKRVKLTVIGSGGAGGGAAATSGTQGAAGAGGGAGGVAIKLIAEASLGATETVTVGAGGGGAAGAGGGNGNTSSFGAHCSATGGAGGTHTGAGTGTAAASGGAGGAGSSGDINFTGGGGGAAFLASTIGMSGAGGSTAYGGGGQGVSASNVGINGGNYGSGGSGAANSISQSARSGGNGAAGIVIVEEFF